MGFVETVLGILAQYLLPLTPVIVVIALIVMYYELRILSSKIDGLNSRIDDLIEFNGSLIEILGARNILSPDTVIALRAFLKAMMLSGSSKYYTKDVEERLRSLLDKEPEELTLEDLKELERIADILSKEAIETGRYELSRYAARLRVYIAAVRGVYIIPRLAREMEKQKKTTSTTTS